MLKEALAMVMVNATVIRGCARDLTKARRSGSYAWACAQCHGIVQVG